ncbi:MAG: PEP-CTERM sorting domain-containing protein [Phenylobacterium sp.]|nr:PEP-CTERM sorting domain-containing protein [Phenylobacterium sp.]
MVFGDDSLFVAWDGTIAEYDLGGNLLASQSYAYSIDSLAYGNGQLFAAANFFGANGLLAFDPQDLTSYDILANLNGEVNSLAFGDGSIYAAFDHSIGRYDTAGVELDSIDTGRRINGYLAFYSDATQGGVPEPSAWALMILGFGLAGSAFRARRKAPAFQA